MTDERTKEADEATATVGMTPRSDLENAATVQQGRGNTRPNPGAPTRPSTAVSAGSGGSDAPTVHSRGGGKEKLASGTQIGRYIILELRGEGGMGVVYAAYDPKLDRRVALKLLHGAPGADGGARLVREAQLLAKVSHPNVVAVHDCGTFGDLVFVEMEFVDGVTLNEWCKGRSWREVLLAYLDAGRALEAVHKVGVVHRDFKPSNVIVDHEGRVRVLDFGIARVVEDDEALLAEGVPPPPTLDPETEATSPMEAIPRAVRSSRLSLDIAKTQRGTATGTPPYMPPEQWKGQVLDARADQYAFAASLFRSFYGVLPFGEPTHATMETAKTRGPAPEQPARSEVPGYVHRALQRALAYEASERFASMGELLAELETDPAAKWRRRAVMALAVVALVTAVVLAYRWEAGREARVCAVTQDRMAGVWDDAKRARVHDAIVKGGRPSAQDTWEKTKRLLDAYADGWLRMRTDACIESQRAPAAARDEAFGARLMCLEWRLQDLKSLTDVLATDSDLVLEAVKAVLGLDPVEDCAKPKLQAALRPPLDAEQRAQFERVRAAIADAKSQTLAGKYKAAIPRAKEAVDDARKHKLRLAEGRALLALGEAQSGAGEYKIESKTLEEALWAAEAAQDDTTVFWALQMLITNVGVSLSDRTMADHWERLASAVLERLGTPDEPASALERARSSLARARADFPGALACSERALALSQRAPKPHTDLAWSEISVASSHLALGHFDEAIAHDERARSLLETLLGPSHPDLTTPMNTMAIAKHRKGDAKGALAVYERSAAIIAEALGPDHPKMAVAHNNIAVTLSDLGRPSEQAAHYEKSLAIKMRVYGPDSDDVAVTLSNLGWVETDATPHGPYPHARERFMRAIAIREKLWGKEDRSLAHPLTGLAELSLREKKLDEAMAAVTRAIDIYTKKQGAEHHDLASPRVVRARIYLASNKPNDAVVEAEHALALHQRAKSEGVGAANAKFVLARALRDANGDRARARQLATEVAAHWAKLGNDPKRKDVEDWLATHEGWLRGASGHQ